MLYLGVSAFLYLIAILFRGIRCKPDCRISDSRFMGPLFVCLFSNVLAGAGFHALLEMPATPEADYSSVLLIISLLTAGVISGKFAFTHHDVATDEVIITTGMSAILALLFYLLFGAVAYYAGLSKGIGDAPYISFSIPVVMWLVLTWNTLHDFWDYRAVDDE